MNNLLVVLDILTVSGVVVCAIIASSCKKLLSSVVALVVHEVLYGERR